MNSLLEWHGTSDESLHFSEPQFPYISPKLARLEDRGQSARLWDMQGQPMMSWGHSRKALAATSAIPNKGERWRRWR